VRFLWSASIISASAYLSIHWYTYIVFHIFLEKSHTFLSSCCLRIISNFRRIWRIKIISEMTYIVSSWTLNATVPIWHSHVLCRITLVLEPHTYTYRQCSTVIVLMMCSFCELCCVMYYCTDLTSLTRQSCVLVGLISSSTSRCQMTSHELPS